MAVITISRQVGSLGTEIAQAVARELHYEYIDKDKIGQALVGYGLPVTAVEKFDEKEPSFWDSWQVQKRRFLHFLQAAIYDFASQGDVVIMGRGGQVLLRNLPGILHVRVVAPFAIRVRRVVEREKGEEGVVAEMLRRSDRDSAGFIRFFFDADWDDPGLYDLVINTQKFSEDSALKAIMDLVLSPEMKESEKAMKKTLADGVLVRKAEAALLDLLESDIGHIFIKAEGGVVTLEGSVISVGHKESCQEIVSRIPGVKKVENRLSSARYFRHGL